MFFWKTLQVHAQLPSSSPPPPIDLGNQKGCCIPGHVVLQPRVDLALDLFRIDGHGALRRRLGACVELILQVLSYCCGLLVCKMLCTSSCQISFPTRGSQTQTGLPQIFASNGATEFTPYLISCCLSSAQEAQRQLRRGGRHVSREICDHRHRSLKRRIPARAHIVRRALILQCDFGQERLRLKIPEETVQDWYYPWSNEVGVVADRGQPGLGSGVVFIYPECLWLPGACV